MDSAVQLEYHRGQYRYDLYNDREELVDELSGIGDSIYIIDRNILRLHAWIRSHLDTPQVRLISVMAGEQTKTLVRVAALAEQLLEEGFTKSTTLVCIGGATLQDLCGSIAGVLFRGARWVYVPTTALAQIDSCIGSKTSLNVGKYKNAAGLFYPPQKIMIHAGFLETLPEQELLSAVGELLHYILPYHMLREKAYELIRSADIDLRGFIGTFRSDVLRIKGNMVEEDEFDTGPRRIFNYGHSFGHAIESVSGFQIPHGIAVALGMIVANSLGRKNKSMNSEYNEALDKCDSICRKVLDLFQKTIGNSFKLRVSEGQLINALKYDKKNDRHSTFNLIIPVDMSEGRLVLEQIEYGYNEMASGVIMHLIGGLGLNWLVVER